MRLYVDLDLRLAVTAPALSPIPLSATTFTRGDVSTLEVQFTRGATVVDPAADTVFFCIKAAGVFVGDPLFLLTDFTKTGTGTTALWTGTVFMENDALTAAVGSLTALLTSAEVGYIAGGLTTTARSLRCILENDIYRGDESVTDPYPARGVVSFYPSITGLTGGTAADLDGQATVNVAVDRVIQIVVDDVLGTWQLQAGTTAENGTSVIRPDDYNASTNAKVWVLLDSTAVNAAAAAASASAASASATTAGTAATTATTQAAAAAASADEAATSATDAGVSSDAATSAANSASDSASTATGAAVDAAASAAASAASAVGADDDATAAAASAAAAAASAADAAAEVAGLAAPGTAGNVLTSNGAVWTSAAPVGGSFTVGTTTITSGTSGHILYDNAGIVGEMTTTGSGTVVALATSPTFVTPALGTPSSGTLTNCTGYPTATATTAGIVPGLGGTVSGNAAKIIAAGASSGAIPQTWLEFPTSHRSGAPYVIGANSSDYGAGDPNQTDAHFVIGFNTTPQTNKIVAGTGATSGRKQYLYFEHDYWSGVGDISTRLDEFHYDVENDAGTSYRIFQITHTPAGTATYQTAWSGSMSFSEVGELGFGTTTIVSRSGLQLDAGASVTAYNQARSTIAALLTLDASNRTVISGFNTGVELGVAPIRLNGNKDNTSTRPATSAAPIPAEIWAYSVQGDTSADGFLRLSAGGGSSGGSTKSRIDISGFSTVGDMDRNIVIYPGATEVARFTTTGTALTGTLSVSGNATLSGNIYTAASPVIQPSGTNQGINVQAFPSGTGTNAQLTVWGKSTTTNADYGYLNYVGGNRMELISSALGSGTARSIFISAGGTQQVEFKTPSGGSGVNFLAIAAVSVLNTTESTSTTTGALKVTGGVGVAKRLTAAVVSTTGYTVATLPAGTVGDRAYVTDALAPTYLGALVGGGAIKCPVFYNGTAWVSA